MFNSRDQTVWNLYFDIQTFNNFKCYVLKTVQNFKYKKLYRTLLIYF